MNRLPLQTRVTLWSSLVVAIGLMLSGGWTALVVHHEELVELDDQIKAEGERFFEEYRRSGRSLETLRSGKGEIRAWLPVSQPPHLVEVVEPNEMVVYRSIKLNSDILRGLPPGIQTIHPGLSKLRVGVFSADGLTLRIAASLAPVDDLTRELLTAFFAAFPLVLIFAFVGGRWIAGRALDPIRRITESATEVTAQHLERRVPMPGTRDDMEKLAIVLNRTFERLESSFHQAVRFSADASHELRTPVTVLRSGLEALVSSPNLTEAELTAVSGLLEQTQRISSIISGLLLLARADAGRLAIEAQPLDFRKIVEECVEDARIIGEAAEVWIEIELPPTAPVRGEAARLMQIVSNLLDNAVKYNVPRGRVDVRLAAREGSWQLDISNTGPGIAPEQQPHIFDRFFRGEHFAGTSGQGLGLSLARELARAHGGTLELRESEPGNTIFRFTIASADGLEPGAAGARVVQPVS